MKEKVLALIDKLMFVESHEIKAILLRNFITENGEIPEEYKDAVNAVMEM